MTLELGTGVLAAGLLAVAMGVGCADGLGPDDFPASDDDDGDIGPGAGGAPPHETTTTTTTSTTASTTTTTTTTTSASVGPSSGSGGVCDNSGDCGSCANCSLGQSCAGEMNACFSDADCSALIDCLGDCFDEVCANACADAHPSGMQLYMAMTMCAFCDACPSDCAVEGQGLCL